MDPLPIPPHLARSLNARLNKNDRWHLKTAEGYVELGMPLEANAELDEITPEQRALPAVLAVRLQACLLAERWELAAVLAKCFAKRIEPENAQWWISWAYAVRHGQKSVEAAEAILLAAKPLLPREATIPFNLACYAAQAGKVNAAKEYLCQAISMDKNMRALALEEPDLEPIW
jgi:Tfp pilus assembly protein PilF